MIRRIPLLAIFSTLLGCATTSSSHDDGIENRILPPPAGVLEYLIKDNQESGYEGVPQVTTPSPDFLADVKAAILEVPAEVRGAIEPHLMGFVFVTGL